MARRGIVDFRTGEVVDLRPGIRRIKLVDLYGNAWAGMNVREFAALLGDREITGVGHRVLGALLHGLGDGNEIPVRAVDLCRQTGINHANMSRIIGTLERKRVIVPRANFGWRLHPRFGFKGNPTGLVDQKTLEFI